MNFFFQDHKLTQESPIWTNHYIEELNLHKEIPPLNGFDEMVTLTNEGKLWKFPIDNEQGNYLNKLIETIIYIRFILN